MKPSSLSLLALAIAATLLASPGCAVRIDEEEVILRLDPGADALDLLLIYRGVSPSDQKEDTLKAAVDLAREIRGKKRAFSMPFAAWDLDDLAAKLARPAGEGAGAQADGQGDDDLPVDPALRESLAAIIRDASVEEVGGFVEGENRLSAYQRFKFRGFSRLIAYLNESIRRGILDRQRDGTLADFGKELLDDRTRELWLERARSGKPWLALRGASLEIDLPMTEASFQRVRAEMLGSSLKDDGLDALGPILAHLTRLDASGDRLVLLFSPAPDGRYVLAFRHLGDAPYDDRLLHALRTEGLELEKDQTVEAVRAKVGPRAASPAAGSSSGSSEKAPGSP